MGQQNVRLGIDVGGTKIEGVALGPRCEILAQMRISTRRGPQCVVDDIVSVAESLCDRVGALKKYQTDIMFTSLGVGIPGRVDSEAGVVLDAVNLSVECLELADEVHSRTGLPVHVENDVNVAALGAVYADNAGLPAEGTVALINLGTGVAVGVVRHGRIDHGAHGVAGEIGHIAVESHGFACVCGQRGCLETVASGGAVDRLWPHGNPAMPDLIAAAERGDDHAEQVLDMVIGGICDVIDIVALTVDPSQMFIAGGMAKTGERLLRLIRTELDHRAQSSPFLASLAISQSVRLAPSHMSIGAVGAALSMS